MNVGTKIQGFVVKRTRYLPELEANLWEMEHMKTGAKLCWLDRKDENKAFSIAFKTVPEDSTGVFHILEHSVLCGSDKYPLKEPFVELLKSSVQTFLNAMTFPDKTVYPVSSRNDQDLLNLMDIYLDAVLHPAIYHKPEIFRQEGWRYELGEQTVYQGVVFNEMKGAFGAPGRVLDSQMHKMLFPDTCYRHVSGGDPKCIPDLSYEQFIANHKKYYHPSNALISLVGSVDLDAVLARIDSFLREFDRQPAEFLIAMQKPVEAKTEQIPYEVGPEEPLTERTILSCGKLLGDYTQQERIFAAYVLANYLAGDNEAPLKRAILDKKLGQDVKMEIHDGIQQAWLSWEVWNTDENKLPAIRQIFRQTLEKIVNEGMDTQRLEACYNRFAFRLRDRDNSGLPRSLADALNVLEGWLYGGDPAQGLLVEAPLAAVAEKLEGDYFAELTRELLLEDSHSVTAVLIPSHDLGKERAEEEKARLESEMALWTEAYRAQLETQAKELQIWQQTPDSEEALAAIPMLQLSDLKEKPEKLPMTVECWKDIPLLRHKTGSSLMYIHCFFDASDLTLEELPVLAMITSVLGKMHTKQHSSQQLQMLVKQKIGDLSFQAGVIPGNDPDHCRVQLSVNVTCLAQQGIEAAKLVGEILRDTEFTDRRLLRDLLQQSAMRTQMSMSSSGHMYAITRVGAYGSAQGVAKEYLSGTEAAAWLKSSSTAEDETLDGILTAMEVIVKRVVTKSRMTLSVSENVTDDMLEQFAFPEGSAMPEFACYAPMGAKQEGVVIPAQVGFAGKGANLRRYGIGFHGSMPVLAGILNFAYLWNEIRVQGGAYGCGFLSRDDGDSFFYTYRDPQPGRSLDVMGGAAEFIRQFCTADPDLTGFVLSSVSSLDPLLNTASKISVAETRYFKGMTYEDICRLYSELIHTSAADLLALCEGLDRIAQDNAVCVVAGQSQLDACGEKLTGRKSV